VGRQRTSISTITATDEAIHADDKAQTGHGREILVEEYMQPMGLTQAALAEAMAVQRKHVNKLCNNRRNVTAATALILARVFGNSPDFWLNVQRRNDLWEAMNSPRERERIERAKPLGAAA
jgi:addiction module HigA family antidote